MPALAKSTTHPNFDIPAGIAPDAVWSIQDAKNQLSQLVRAAAAGVSQCVTVHGKPTAVVLSIEDYKMIKKNKTTHKPLSQLLLRPGLLDAESADLFERRNDTREHRLWV